MDTHERKNVSPSTDREPSKSKPYMADFLLTSTARYGTERYWSLRPVVEGLDAGCPVSAAYSALVHLLTRANLQVTAHPLEQATVDFKSNKQC